MSNLQQRIREIEAISDEQIDYTDIPELDERFWSRAELRMPEPQRGVYVRLDADILAWLESNGQGYQARLNGVLRELMERDRTAA